MKDPATGMDTFSFNNVGAQGVTVYVLCQFVCHKLFFSSIVTYALFLRVSFEHTVSEKEKPKMLCLVKRIEMCTWLLSL